MRANCTGMERALFLWIVIIAYLGYVEPCRANTNVRTWNFTSGKSISAELVDYNEASGMVHLRINETDDITIPASSLSIADRAWLNELNDMKDEQQALIKKLGGTLTFHQSSGPMSTGFYVYRPSKTTSDQKLPMVILFEPSAKATDYVTRFAEAAEAVQCTIVCCDTFRNTKDNDVLEAQFLERFKLLLPVIEATVAHDPRKLFLGGTSGGAWRAYHYAALISRPWAGIFANGGWLGGEKYYNLTYPPNLRVSMVNGNQDIAASTYVEPDSLILTEHGDVVEVLSFEGGHQIPPVSVQIKSFEWLLGK